MENEGTEIGKKPGCVEGIICLVGVIGGQVLIQAEIIRGPAIDIVVTGLLIGGIYFFIRWCLGKRKK